MEGDVNPADWLMKSRSLKELGADGFWQRGPDFLRMEFKSWPIRTTFRMDRLDGELSLTQEFVSNVMLSVSMEDCLWKLLEEKSSLKSLHRLLALILRWRSVSTLRKYGRQQLTMVEIREAKLVWKL